MDYDSIDWFVCFGFLVGNIPVDRCFLRAFGMFCGLKLEANSVFWKFVDAKNLWFDWDVGSIYGFLELHFKVFWLLFVDNVLGFLTCCVCG